ncbi:DNA protecting protein DprA [Candidatus Beckwithbacteria bacterium CG1_02_47_37]|uniref:DNA protecting protein DprA n=3 Tax=Candidatus Beckwithiibacteriota TaxID=1752726 RepID=A0A1J4RSG9_9BACT|nr:MAG: DNA protecting protein DprA [Candidatus Beckwithbacteria bacterium CG1_02_47_37]
MVGWREREIKSLNSQAWPKGLGRVTPKIKQLYYRGNWDSKLFTKAVAVVGARRMTKYGEVMTRKIVAGLVEAGYTIVSGFMYGVDTMAHKTCLDNKGRTVAVLGSGLDCLTPAENDNLYSQILESGGLVISEFQAKQEAKLWTFPYRNRIVVGLSRALVVVEAGEKSGSLVTANWAFKQKKPVLAVPGAVTSSLSVGTNWLIKNGAKLATDANDVLAVLGENNRVKWKGRTLPLSGEEKAVVELLRREEMDADEICRKLNKPVSVVSILLSNLGLKGVIEESGGKFMVV